jgi:hypothetical protein
MKSILFKLILTLSLGLSALTFMGQSFALIADEGVESWDSSESVELEAELNEYYEDFFAPPVSTPGQCSGGREDLYGNCKADCGEYICYFKKVNGRCNHNDNKTPKNCQWDDAEKEWNCDLGKGKATCEEPSNPVDPMPED